MLRNFWTVMLWTAALGLCAGSAYAALPDDVSGYFTHFSDDVAALIQSSSLTGTNIDDADVALKKFAGKYPAAVSLIRVNSRGIIINEISASKETRTTRDLSVQPWFASVRDLVPYYGNLRTVTGDYLLFWCVPIIIEGSGGEKRFGGALVVKFDLAASFGEMAAKTNAAFGVTYKNKSLSFGDFSGQQDAEKVFDLDGIGTVTIRYPGSANADQPPAAAPHAVAEKPAGSSAGPAPVAQKAVSAKKKTAETVSSVPSAEETVPARKPVKSVFLIVLVLLIISIAFGALAIALPILSRRKQEAITRHIDMQAAPDTYGKTVVVNRDKLKESLQAPAAEHNEEPHTTPEKKKTELLAQPGAFPHTSLYGGETVRIKMPQTTAATPPLPDSRPQAISDETLIVEVPVKPPASAKEVLSPEKSSAPAVDLDVVRTEIEVRVRRELDAVWEEKSRQMQKDAYAQIRLTVLQNLKSYSLAIGRQIEDLNKMASSATGANEAGADEIRTIVYELSRVRDALEGRTPQQRTTTNKP